MRLTRQILFFLVVGAVALVGSESIAGGIALSGLRIATHASADQIARKPDLLIFAGFKEKAREKTRAAAAALKRKQEQLSRSRAAEAARKLKDAAARKATAVQFGYDRSGFEGYSGNVGLSAVMTGIQAT